MKRRLSLLICLITLAAMILSGCELLDGIPGNNDDPNPPSVSLDSIPEFDGSTQYVIINENLPFFENEKNDSSYETYSELDSLGRCGTAIACIGTDIMPTEEREDIGHVKPSGWHSVQYDIVSGGYLYNRCHLIGHQLTGENDNEKNLITGTRDMNNEGMLPFENKVAEYITRTGNHVLYRVTPIFNGNELVARGVLMEAKSVEDDDLCFCIYVYNAQPGIVIDYRNGESRLADHPYAEFITDNHEELEILPSAAADTVSCVYIEYGEGDELTGAVVIATVDGNASEITVAVDINALGRVEFVEIISESETHEKGSEIDAYLDDFAGCDIVSVQNVDVVSGATVTSTALREAVRDAVAAFLACVDAMENGEIYVINISSCKFHTEDCSGAKSMSEKNKLVYIGYAEDLTKAGYTPCGTCDPIK